MEIILFVGVISSLSLLLSFLQYRRKKAVVKELLRHSGFQIYDYSKKFYAVFVVLLILCILMSILSFYNENVFGIILSFILLIMVAAISLTLIGNSKFYYNNTACVLAGKLVRYKNITEFWPKRFSISRQQYIFTIDEDIFRVRKVIADLIQLKIKDFEDTKPKPKPKKPTKKKHKKKSSDN